VLFVFSWFLALLFRYFVDIICIRYVVYGVGQVFHFYEQINFIYVQTHAYHSSSHFAVEPGLPSCSLIFLLLYYL